MRAKPRAQAASVVGRTRVGTRVTFSLQTPVLSTGTQAATATTPGRSPRTPPGAPGVLPGSQRSQGLPQAAPRVAQHWDRREVPGRFASQRPSWTCSQQVPRVLSAGEAVPHVPCQPTPARRPAEAGPPPSPPPGVGRRAGRQGAGCTAGPGASHLDTRCRTAPAGCRGRTRRHRSQPGSGTRHLHMGWTGTRRCLQ